jgi:PAS domain-containing protein
MDDRSHASAAAKNALLDAALDGIRSGLSIWTADFKLVFWNQPFLAIYNLKPGDICEGAGLETF